MAAFVHDDESIKPWSREALEKGELPTIERVIPLEESVMSSLPRVSSVPFHHGDAASQHLIRPEQH